MAAVEQQQQQQRPAPAAVAKQPPGGDPKQWTNGYQANNDKEEEQQRLDRMSNSGSGPESNGGGPLPPPAEANGGGGGGGYYGPSAGPYSHPAYYGGGAPYPGSGFPGKGVALGPGPVPGYPPGSGYGPPPGSGPPTTPTLNSLLQDRGQPPQQHHFAGGYDGGPPRNGPPGGSGGATGGNNGPMPGSGGAGPPPGFPGWGYPAYRGQGPPGPGRPYGGYGGGPPYPGYPQQQQQPRYGSPGDHPPGGGGYPGLDARAPFAPQSHSGHLPDMESGGSGGGRSPSDDGRSEESSSGGGGVRGGGGGAASPRPRPSPSPTGSSSSRSMSPAIGQTRDGPVSMPPRPASGTSEGNGAMSGPTMTSSSSPAPHHSPYAQPPNMGPPPHMYKAGPPGGPMPPYGGYPGYGGGGPPRAAGVYGGGGPPYGVMPGYGGPPRNNSPGPPPAGAQLPPAQYPGYGGPPQQQPAYPQSWNNGGAPPPKGGSGAQPPPPSSSPQHHQQAPPRHPGMPQQGPPPGVSSGMRMMGGPQPAGSLYGAVGPKGPPYGPPGVGGYNGPPQFNGPSSMMPPHPHHHMHPAYPPGSSSPYGPPLPAPASSSSGGGPHPPETNNSMSNNMSESSSSSSSLVTTGPDGQPMHDETSQQSTLSQSSDNSGGRQTPKGYSQGFGSGAPGTPHSAPSPGSLASQDDLYQRDVGSPGGHSWGGRVVPPSPVGTPGPQAKVENLQRLYEIDDHPERRAWLDRLLSFMEDRGTPITQCPTISKNPLDLYRLYIFTKDRGGFLECTNKKAWKDIAAQLGIGPSSSGAYTLKKHYGKNLLPFECHFERGGVDPAPILAQVEAQSKKKGKSSQQARPPSPGSQDSHDSYSGSQDGYGSGGYPPGGYGGFPPPDPRQGGPPHPGQYPPGSAYPPPRPPDGYGPPPQGYGGYPPPRGWGGGPQYEGAGPPPPSDPMYGRGPGGWPGGPPPGSAGYPPSRPPGGSYPPPTPGGSAGGPSPAPPTSTSAPTPPGSSSPGPSPSPTPVSGASGTAPPQQPGAAPPFDYQKGASAANGLGSGPPYSPTQGGGGGGSGAPSPTPPYAGYPGAPQGPRMMMRPNLPQGPSHPVILRANSPATPGTIQDSLPPALPVQRIPNPHGYAPSSPAGGGMPPPGSNNSSPGGNPSSGGGSFPPIGSKPPTGGPPAPGPPPASSPSQGPPPQPGSGGPPPPNRSPYPPGGPYPPHRPMYPERGGGLIVDSPMGGQGSGPPPPGWQNRYPPGQPGAYGATPSSGGPPRPGPPSWGGPGDPQQRPYAPQYGGPPQSAPWPPRPPQGAVRPGQPYRPEMRGGPSGPQQQMSRSMGPGRREMYNFPPDCVESTQPLLVKRKRLNKLDVQPVEGWRLVMALRSGLMGETTWALDTLNILLFDDNSVTYFGLGNMPGLLEALIEHWRASLIAMFDDVTKDLELTSERAETGRKRKRDRMEKAAQAVKWYEKRPEIVEDELFLGGVESEVLRKGDKVRILHHQPKDFTQEARFSDKEFQFDEQDDALFVADGLRDWDDESTSCAQPDLWLAGGGAPTNHIIQANSLNLDIRLPFVRILKDGKDPDCSDTNSCGIFAPKKEPAEPSNAAAGTTKTGGDVSPGKKQHHAKRVREVWAVNSHNKEEAVGNGKSDSHKHSDAETVNGGSVKQSKDSNNDRLSAHSEGEEKTSLVVATSEQTTTSAVKKEKECDDDDDQVSRDKSEEQEEVEDPVESLQRRTGLILRDAEAVRRRWAEPVLEEENYQPDQASLNLVTESQDALGRRAIAVSTIFRNLSFVPGNEPILGSCPGFLAICGRLLLLGHWHPVRSSKQRNYERGEEEETAESCTSLMVQRDWWWEHIQLIRENVMVALSNIAGHLELGPLPESIVLPLLSGLLEWAVSPAAAAQDPFYTVGPASNISPQRLAIESLCKLCIQETNVDLLLSTPPYSRLEQLCSFLSKKLYRSEDQVMREFAINLLYYFSQADSGVARTIALQDTTVSLLIGFIEQAESNALLVAQQHGVNALRDNPDSMGTSLDMLRRAANTLNNLARHQDNAPLFLRQEQRLLNLVMSQILDQGVAGILSQVIFQISSTTGASTPPQAAAT